MAPRSYVPSPVFTPLPFGLLSALADSIRQPSDVHWQAGVTYEVLCAAGGTTYDECFAVTGSGGSAGAPAPAAKIATAALDQRGATAFTVISRVDCSAPGFWDRAAEVVGDSFTHSEQWQVERAFWTGVAAGQPVVFPHLAANTEVVDEFGILLQTAATTVVSGGVPLDVVEGLGRLEEALANCYDGVGVIHVPRSLAPSLIDSLLIYREGPRYRTTNGNIVVLGSGYRHTSPAGVDSDSSTWIYATGAMFIYRSSPRVFSTRDSFSQAVNQVEAMVERTYVVGWDCCHLGVNITLGGVPAGAPGTAGSA